MLFSQGNESKAGQDVVNNLFVPHIISPASVCQGTVDRAQAYLCIPEHLYLRTHGAVISCVKFC